MKKCELLVPAGGKKQFIAAVENGADAVYIGGPLYNARMGADNFSTEEIERAIDFAHLRNVKVYVTMNTLMENGELDAGVGLAEILREKGADGLIIQDLGLGKRIKELMPDFPLHLSTQATVYNRHGLEAAAKLGYERAVLARELSIEQIEICSKPSIIETEVFVHGALCMCYSGQCQMSRFIGGRSGNKGRCAQPCRLPYTYDGVEGYPLSPKDLSMIDMLGKLVEAGVSSLKIEGRMKSPEYVATVTRVYRKYLDEYYNHGSYCVESQDRQALMQIFNRGGFTRGYAENDPGDELMSGLLPKNQGIRIGHITGAVKGGILADTELSVPLEMGDVVEIHGKQLWSTKVTYLEQIGKNKVRFGDLKEKVYPGEEIYRIVSANLMKKAEESVSGADFEGGFYGGRRKIPVDMTFIAQAGKPAELTVSCTDTDGERIAVKHISHDLIPQEAISRATGEDEIAARLAKTGNTTFAAGKIKIICGENIFMPVSGINGIRREALERLANEKISMYKKKPLGDLYSSKPLTQMAEDKSRFFELYFLSAKEFFTADIEKLMKIAEMSGAKEDEVRILLPLKDMADNMLAMLLLEEKLQNKIVPYIPNVTAGPCDKWLDENLTAAAELVKNFGGKVYVGNIGWIQPFAEKGVEVLGDFGLNITNDESVEAYRSLGMSGTGTRSLEETSGDCGAFPLMITEHDMKDGTLTDRKGAEYKVTFDKNSHKTVIRAHRTKFDSDMLKSLKRMWEDGKTNLRLYV